jgi:hypothetical protein
VRVFLLVSALIGLCITAAVSVYALLLSDAGHTGKDPFATFLYLVPLLLVSGVSLRRSPLLKREARFGAGVAFLGMLVVALLDATNQLVQYDRWTERGLPERGSISLPLLVNGYSSSNRTGETTSHDVAGGGFSTARDLGN